GEQKGTDGTFQRYRVTLSAEAYAAAQTQLSTARRTALRAELGPGPVVLDLLLNDKDQLTEVHRRGPGRSDAANRTVQYTEFGGPL
ncbi:hypothetical protein, partial [Saccharothrix sp. ST-888]|uniref:hypothetical protein n=1 Tax=Saccharothrix sp. ST-888 TaxID=1427391 RepID=UPI0005ECB04D